MQPVLFIVIPLLMAFVSINLKKSHAKYLLILVGLFNALGTLFVDKGVYLIGGFAKEYSISLVLDDYSLIAIQVINIAFIFLILISLNKLNKMATVVMISMAGLNGLLLTNDLFNLFVFLEVSSIAAYILTTQSKDYKATFNYLVLGVFGSSLYLLGIVLIYKMVGFLEFGKVAELTKSGNYLVPLLLIFGGFAVEAKLLPFSGWVRDILKGANEFTSVLIASIYAGTMMFVLGRLLMVFNVEGSLMTVLIVIGLITMILGEIAAYSADNLKEVLAYSSIGQAGLVFLLLLSNFYTLAIMLIIGNVVVKFLLFNFAARLETDQLSKLQGIFVKNKIVGVSVTMAFLSLLGVPFFYGFIVKLNLLMNLMLMNQFILVIAILFVAVVEAGYIIKMLVAFWNPGEEGETPSMKFESKVNFNSTIAFKYAAVLIALGLLTLGIMPKYLYDYTDGQNDEIVNQYPIILIDEIGGSK